MKKILVVEDDRGAAKALATRLSSEGYAPAVTHSVWQALETAQKDDFDLFLLDLGLPDGDGLNLATRLITLPGSQATPVLFLTGTGDFQARLNASKLGVTAWLDKPYRPEDLRQAVATALKVSSGSNQFSPLAPMYQPKSSPRKAPSTVLVLEDDKRFCQAMECRLSHAGYKVVSARTGGDGLSLAEQHRPSLILSDIYMPGGLGLTLFENLAERGLVNIPVIFVTASKRAGLKDSALRLGAAGFVEKPCEFPEILRCVRRALFQNQ